MLLQMYCVVISQSFENTITYYCFELCEDFIHIIIARLKKVKMKEIGYQRSVNGQAFTIFGWKNYGLISEMSSRRVDENVRCLWTCAETFIYS